MPVSHHTTLLCRYQYDPLDRLINCAPSAEADIQRFYCKNRLVTEIQGAVQRNIFQHDDVLLAQRHREEATVDTTLLVTDQQRSVLNALDATRPHPLAYMPYGHRPVENGWLGLLGFNGDRPEPMTGHYVLGNGYRAFNPVLMRFNSPDELSPFGKGGINSYAYCLNDPVNRKDPGGYFSISGLVKPFKYLRRQIVRPYYKVASKSRSAAGTPLKNQYDHPLVNVVEDVMLTADILEGNAKVTSVASKKDLVYIKSSAWEHKYILTSDNRLVVGSFYSTNTAFEPKHSAIARISAPESDVVSAGVITRTKKGFEVTNNSGHFQPTPEVNALAKFKLRSLGVKVTSKNYEIRI
ncbi:RHS repeat-associated core domain-containing protein [Pseudomonas fluorescens]|jgi:RHS repeat-associated protein|uniref:RHS repeat-associated core domain-containing protein n=1 Tax=Pseudomonas fluorescens TaxID=294 RepID=UPI002784CD2F|nr:RHS repeat-associated core domain-containing protein [Pseudomonas fluorescens]MDP9782228.1 RHS repeat-associated protein [Pseudomonas fluorescens]